MQRQYPKIWGLGNPGVARGAHRTLGLPFQTKSTPGAIAQTQGLFSAIHLEEGEFDGWYSPSSPDFAPTFIRGTPRPKIRFKKRGVLEDAAGVTRFSPGLSASGDGWAWITQNVEVSMGVYTIEFHRTMNGGRTSREQFQHAQATPLENVGIANLFIPTWWLSPGILIHFPIFLAEDINRQKPQTRLYFREDGDWFFADFAMPVLEEDKDYTFGSINTTLPGVWVFTTAQFNALPELYVTFDSGENWGSFAMDETNFFPDLDMPVPDWPDEAAAPGGTPDEKRANFINQTEVQAITGFSHPGTGMLSLRRILVATFYPISYPGTWQTAVTLFDYVNGVVEDQWIYDDAPAEDSRFVTPVGENSWITYKAHFDGSPEVPDADFELQDFELTTDSGGSFTDISGDLEPGVRSIDPIVGAARPDEDPIIFPKIYYVVRTAGQDRELWASSDLFATPSDRQSLVAPASAVLYNHDYNMVAWIGQPWRDAAPCDPSVPWSLDSRVTAPEWWFDGLTP